MFRLLRTVVWLVAIVVVAAGVVLVTALEDAPLVARGPAPSPEDVAATRRFVHDIRRAARTPAGGDIVAISEPQANSVIRLARRLVPGLRGTVEVAPERVVIRTSMPVPWPGGRKWLNAEAAAPEFTGRASLDTVRVGRWSLPAGPSVEAARIGANLVLGNRAGDVFLDSATALDIQGREMRLVMRLDEGDKQAFARGIFGSLRGSEMPAPDEIEQEYRAIRTAMDAGVLPSEGSLAPYLRFILRRVADRATDGSLANDYTAAIFGLTKVCGLKEFTLFVGRFADGPVGDAGTWRTECDDVSLAGRSDLKRHFVVAAAIKAASNRGVAVSMGEFKELYDTSYGARSGFDFTDIAADNAGVRFSDLVMSGTVEDLKRLLSVLGTEEAVMPDIAQLPRSMKRSEFEARYGSIDSPAYAGMIDRIEGMIDRTPIHRLGN